MNAIDSLVCVEVILSDGTESNRRHSDIGLQSNALPNELPLANIKFYGDKISIQAFFNKNIQRAILMHLYVIQKPFKPLQHHKSEEIMSVNVSDKIHFPGKCSIHWISYLRILQLFRVRSLTVVRLYKIGAFPSPVLIKLLLLGKQNSIVSPQTCTC